jgi:RimJ/RimL family protein N-acetyltransferase
VDGADNRGFWLDPAWQGHGLMTEAADAVTRYWFEVLGRPSLRVPKAVANAASRRVSERAGMRVVATEERDYLSGRHTTEI